MEVFGVPWLSKEMAEVEDDGLSVHVSSFRFLVRRLQKPKAKSQKKSYFCALNKKECNGEAKGERIP